MVVYERKYLVKRTINDKNEVEYIVIKPVYNEDMFLKEYCFTEGDSHNYVMLILVYDSYKCEYSVMVEYCNSEIREIFRMSVPYERFFGTAHIEQIIDTILSQYEQHDDDLKLLQCAKDGFVQIRYEINNE